MGPLPIAARFTWNVSNISLPAPDDQTSLAGSVVNLTVAATAPAGETLSFSEIGLPQGLVINPDSGLISGTVAASAASTDPYLVTVTATDGSHVSHASFSWTVDTAELANPGNQAAEVGDQVLLHLVGSSSGPSLTYQASNLPEGLTLNMATGWISGTIVASAATATPYHVTISDSDGLDTATQEFTWMVVADTNTLQLTNPGNQTTKAASNANLTITAVDPRRTPLEL